MKLWVFAAAALATAAPVAAQQFSDGYTFLKGVRDRDAAAVEGVLANPSTTAVNARDSSNGESALHIVVGRRDATWLSYLLARGARPDLQDNDGDSALHAAARLGWVEGAEALLGRGAPVDQANDMGETPLIIAVQQRDLPMVRLLLQSGADAARTDSAAGLSALDYARRDRRSAAILRLLEAPPARARQAVGPN